MLGKKLFIFIIALTLAFSVVSSVDPFFLNNTKAFADNGSDDEEDEEKQNSSEDEEEDDDSSKDDEDEDERDDDSSKDDDEDAEEEDDSDEKDDDSDEEKDDEEEDDDSEKGRSDDKDEKSEDKLVQQLGQNSKASLKIEDETELEVEIEDGDLADGMYDVQFSCTSPEVNETFDIMVTNGNGESEFKLDLAEGSYSGCEVKVGDLSAEFDRFTVAAREHEEEEEEDEDKEREHDMDREQKSKAKLDVEHDGVEIEIEMEGLSMADGLYDVMFSCEEQNVEKTFEDAFEVKDGKGEFETKFDLEEGTYNGCKVTIDETVITFDSFTVLNKEVRESRHDREQEIVSTNTASEIHERHIQAQPASPGPYEPGLEYMLTTAGTAENDDMVEDAELNLEAAVWKSNNALVFLDILGGDVTIGDKTYEIVLGYGLFSMNSDTLRARAFAVDDAGDVFVLKLRGVAEMHEEMPEDENELDSLHLMFEGNSGPSKNELNGWELFLDGAIQKSE
jgi:hypothetical protein